MAKEKAASDTKPAPDKKPESDKKTTPEKKPASGKKTTTSKKSSTGKKPSTTKKAATSKKKTPDQKKKSPAFDLTLPQNIVPIGEQNNEDKKIYISQRTYREIHRFTKDKTKVESGGVILGNVIEEFGKTHIIIRAFIEAKYCEGTPTTLKFTHESWEYIHKEAEKKYPKYKILGWIHTHPDFGIFLSEYDKFIHENFFNEENQVAYVVDPIQNIEGFYFWINGNLERCKGFFIFERTGVQITVEDEKEDNSSDSVAYREKNSVIKNVVLVAMAMAIIALIIVCFSMQSKLNSVQEQQAAIANNLKADNQGMSAMMAQMSAMSTELENAKKRIAELEKIHGIEQSTQPQSQPQAESQTQPQTEAARGDQENTEATSAPADGNSDQDSQAPAATEATTTNE